MDYHSVVQDYHKGALSPSECVRLMQFLLDTDCINEFPELLEVSEYYVLEGLCYQVGYILE